MLKALAAGLIILAMLLGWLAVQNMARAFAKRHPEFGPYVEKRGCGGNCSCGNKGGCKSQS